MRALAFETAVDRVIKAPRQEAAFIYFWTTSYSLPKSSGLRLFSTVKTLSISCPFDLEVFSSCSYFLLKSRIVFSFSFGKSVLNIFTQAAAPVSLANYVILNLSSFAYLMYFPRVPLASPILFSVAKLLTEPRAEREAAVRFVSINKDWLPILLIIRSFQHQKAVKIFKICEIVFSINLFVVLSHS